MITIQQKFVKYNYTKRSQKPVYICIHDTGNPGAGALNHYNYFNGGNRGSSADYFVDSNNIIQIINTDVNYSWAVGDGKGKYGITNGNSVSIEMCLEKNGQPSQATIQHTLDLTKYLMNKYGIKADKVCTHYMASRKLCPNSFKANNWAKWNEFKSLLINTSANVNISNATPAGVKSNGNYNATITNDFFYTRDKNGNKDGGRIEIGTKIKVLDVLYTKQLAYVEYSVLGNAKRTYITNATNCINYLYNYEWSNGSTNESVYETASKTNKIGILSPYEKATPLYRENGMLHVVYDTDKGKNTKSGFVAYDGNFNKL